MARGFPRFAADLEQECTRLKVAQMLRNRGYQLHETRYRRDRGLVRVYMADSWADPMLFQIGQYREGEASDWAAVYDAAMARHLHTKANHNRYGD